MSTPWECPRCGAINAPHALQCSCARFDVVSAPVCRGCGFAIEPGNEAVHRECTQLKPVRGE